MKVYKVISILLLCSTMSQAYQETRRFMSKPQPQKKDLNSRQITIASAGIGTIALIGFMISRGKQTDLPQPAQQQFPTQSPQNSADTMQEFFDPLNGDESGNTEVEQENSIKPKPLFTPNSDEDVDQILEESFEMLRKAPTTEFDPTPFDNIINSFDQEVEMQKINDQLLSLAHEKSIIAQQRQEAAAHIEALEKNRRRKKATDF